MDINTATIARIDEDPLSQGLSEIEAAKLISDGMGNNVEPKTSRSYKEILKENLFTFFNIVLFVLGVLLAAMGKPGEAFITTGVVFVNVLVAVIQEVQAKRKLDQIALLTRPKARVVRDGVEKEMDPSGIVLGDVLVVTPGDQIIVDGEIIGGGKVDIDESLLTGETDNIPKTTGDTVLSGSFVVTGKAYYKATKVGADCYINKLTEDARSFKRNQTPLQREVDLIIRILLVVIVFFGILLTISAILNDVSFLESVRIASVLFGLAPSSLFLMIVVAYAMGALRIANKGALVQQANSVESLCHVTVLCLDKTGTLTANQICLDDIHPLKENVDKSSLEKVIGSYARSATTSNPTNEALIEGCDGKKSEFREEVPFSSQWKWSAQSFDSGEMKGTFVLGAPKMLENNLKHGTFPAELTEQLSDRGLRVLLFAYRPDCPPLNNNDKPILPDNLDPLCIISFSDVLRPNIRETLKGFEDAGIELKIISGDDPRTVAALAKQAGIVVKGKELKLISGPELEEMDDSAFKSSARDCTIFGRITPQQKEKLVKTLKEQGQYVAMTGDGVNDVLALKQANLGIAMQSGSQATRSVAGIVLLNDSFEALPAAFREGQRILNGMKDIFKLYMVRILYLTFLISSIAVIGVGFPFTPTQSSLISILTLSIPSFALAVFAKPGPVGKGSMTRKMMHFVIPAVITLTGAGLIVYLFFLLTTDMTTGNADISYAQQALTYLTVVCGLLIIIFAEPPTEAWSGGDKVSGDWRPTIVAIIMFILFIFLIASPKFRHIYEMILLRSPLDYIIIGLVIAIWALVLKYFWTAQLVDRYLNVDLTGEGDPIL